MVPAYAQMSDAEKLGKNVTEAVQKEKEEDDTYWVNKGASFVKESCSIRGTECVLEVLFEAEKAAGGDVLKAVVCSDKNSEECVPALAYAQGAVHYAVKNLLYYEGKLIVETAPDFMDLISNYGMHFESDREAAMKYLQAVYNTESKDCSGGLFADRGWTAEQKADNRMRAQIKQNRCAVELSTLPVMALLAKTPEEKKYVTKKAAKLLDKGGSWVGTAMTALGVLGTQEAYQAVENYLEDQLPSRLGNALHVVDSPARSLAREGLKKTSSVVRGGNANYLTRISEDYQYDDPEEMKRQGVRSTGSFPGEVNPYPQGNYLEDVGMMLADQSFTNPYAAALAKRLVNEANEATTEGSRTSGKAGKITYPVILGILDGWRRNEGNKKFIYVPSPELLSFFYQGDWFDLNEATQRRVHYKAYQFAKARGWGWKAPVKDPEKLERDKANESVLAVAQGIDFVYQVYLVLGLVKLAVVKGPSLARGVKLLRSHRGRMFTKNYIRKLPNKTLNKVTAQYQSAKQSAKTVYTGAKQRVQQVASTIKDGKISTGSKSAVAGTMTGTASTATKGSSTVKVSKTVSKGKKVAPTKAVSAPKATAVSSVELEGRLNGPLQASVQQAGSVSTPQSAGNTAVESIKRGVQYVRNAADDYFKAMAESHKGALQMSLPGLPGPGFLASWKAARAERAAEEAVKVSNLIKAESLDAGHYMAYIVGEDGKVAKQIISNKKYQSLVKSATRADADNWGLRQMKYRREIQALDNPGVEMVGRKPASTNMVKVAERSANPVRDNYWEVLHQDAKEYSSGYWDEVAGRLRDAGDAQYARVAETNAAKARQLETAAGGIKPTAPRVMPAGQPAATSATAKAVTQEQQTAKMVAAERKVEEARKNSRAVRQQLDKLQAEKQNLLTQQQQHTTKLQEARTQVAKAEQNVQEAQKMAKSKKAALETAEQRLANVQKERSSTADILSKELDKQGEYERVLKESREELQRLEELTPDYSRAVSYWKEQQKNLPALIDKLETATYEAKNAVGDAAKAVEESKRKFGNWSAQYKRAVQAEQEATEAAAKAQQKWQNAKNSTDQIAAKVRQAETEAKQHVARIIDVKSTIKTQELKLRSIEEYRASLQYAPTLEKGGRSSVQFANDASWNASWDEKEALQALKQAQDAVRQEETALQTIEGQLKTTNDAMRQAKEAVSQADGIVGQMESEAAQIRHQVYIERMNASAQTGASRTPATATPHKKMEI
jgi:hypothetical protein